MFVCKTRSLPKSGERERWFTQVSSGLVCKHKTRFERLAMYKYSSLLQAFKIANVKSFITLGAGPHLMNKLLELVSSIIQAK